MMRVGLLGIVALCAGAGCAGAMAEMEADSLFHSATAAHQRADAQGAWKGYRASLAAHPTSPAANNLGVLHAERGDAEGARRWFAYAVSLNEVDMVARANLGVVLYHLGRTGEAAEALTAARKTRQAQIDRTLPHGRVNWDRDLYAAATERADEIAAKYLDRLMGTFALPQTDTQLALSVTRVPAM